MKSHWYWATLMIVLLLAEGALRAQARNEASLDWAPDQLTATFLYTADDYSLQVSASSLRRTLLEGVGVEYASRHFYPWEVVGAVQYSEGEPLGQKLVSTGAGVGYCRNLKGWVPFARVVAGATRTSSADLMYLYRSPRWGAAFSTAAGVDYRITPRWGIRMAQLQDEYLPYGSRGSVYWSFGTGITYIIRR